jgi:hypothetical protein
VVKVNVKTGFSFAHNGYDVREYTPGVQEIPGDAAELAIEEGWAEKHASSEKAQTAAPANKAQRAARANKGR